MLEAEKDGKKYVYFIVLRGGSRLNADIRYVHVDSVQTLKDEITKMYPIWAVEAGKPWWEGRHTEHVLHPSKEIL